MKNTAHVQATFYLMFKTELDEEEYQNKFNEETLVGSKVEITLPDGRTYQACLSDLVGWDKVDFEENKVDKEKVTKHIA